VNFLSWIETGGGVPTIFDGLRYGKFDAAKMLFSAEGSQLVPALST
jgi:hypothetical protein